MAKIPFFLTKKKEAKLLPLMKIYNAFLLPSVS